MPNSQIKCHRCACEKHCENPCNNCQNCECCACQECLTKTAQKKRLNFSNKI